MQLNGTAVQDCVGYMISKEKVTFLSVATGAGVLQASVHQVKLCLSVNTNKYIPGIHTIFVSDDMLPISRLFFQ